MEFIEDKLAFYRYLYQECHCVNAGQSQEFRRLKYAIARSFGKSSHDSAILRDYRKTTFAKYFGYSSFESLISSLS